MHPELKHWQKRPLHSHLMDFAACKVVNVWGLAETVMKEVGDAGLAGTIRLCKQVMQQHFQDADKMPADEEARYVCLSAEMVLEIFAINHSVQAISAASFESLMSCVDWSDALTGTGHVS